MAEITSSVTIGFFDQSSPQTTANTQRVWSFGRPVLIKNTAHLRANTFGFYSINGKSVVEHHDHSKKDDVCHFLGSIRKANPDGDIIIILDNFRSHHAHLTLAYARQNRIILVFLPPYSPDLNPIEYIWKSIKRIISQTFIRDLDHMKQIIVDAFKKYSGSIGFARAWITKFLGNDFRIIS